MQLSGETIERGIERFRELVEADPGLRHELGASRSAFFGPLEAGDYGEGERLALRRHLEWFLFERPSEVLGGVPVEALMERWMQAADGLELDHVEAFLNSRSAVFEVSGVQTGQGIWLRDLLGLGEYPIEEPAAAAEFEDGDLVVGRIFPVGDELHRLSPAAICFRNAELAHALRADMERLRSSRRGPLRIAQTELERMFFAPGADRRAKGVDRDGALRRARQELAAAGLTADHIESVLDELGEAADDPGAPGRRGGAAVTEALNRLAFETSVDLEVAHRVLLELWSSWTARSPASRAVATERADRGAPAEAVRAALDRFDEGRRSGRDLEELFRTLEEDLGINRPGEEADDAGAPDFPGVVGAMIEEFLWESGREEGPAVAEGWTSLRRFGRFARSLGVFENLGREQLLDFAARWLLDEGELADAAEARALLEALGAFCRWSEERQKVPLWQAFGATLSRLEDSLPRLVEARRRCARGEHATLLYELARGADGEPVLVDEDRSERAVRIDPALDEHLRPGDLVRAWIDAEGRATVSACYPPELLELRSR